MASSELVAQILADQQGIGFSPRENIYGQIGGTLAGALPQLVSPYASTKSNIATVLGGSLLAGLLGYQARQEAEAQNQVLMPALTEIVGAGTQQEVADIYGQLPSDMQSRLGSIAVNRLGTIQERELARQLAEQERKQAIELAGLKEGIIAPGLRDVLGTGATFPAGSSKLFQMEDTLRTELNNLPETKDYGEVKISAETVAAAVKDPSAVADQELVRRAILLIEPGMAVKEGEQAAVAASQSIPERYKGELNRVMTGQGSLGPQLREGIMRIAERSYKAYSAAYNKTKDFYDQRAIERGIDPARISRFGKAPTFEEIIKRQAKAEERGEQVTKAIGQETLEKDIEMRLGALARKGLANLSAVEREEVKKLKAQYEELQNGR